MIGFAFRGILRNFPAGILLLVSEPFRNLYISAVMVNSAHDKRRLQSDIGVAYGDDIERAMRIILDTVRENPDMLREPAVDVLVGPKAGERRVACG